MQCFGRFVQTSLVPNSPPPLFPVSLLHRAPRRGGGGEHKAVNKWLDNYTNKQKHWLLESKREREKKKSVFIFKIHAEKVARESLCAFLRK